MHITETNEQKPQLKFDATEEISRKAEKRGAESKE